MMRVWVIEGIGRARFVIIMGLTSILFPDFFAALFGVFLGVLFTVLVDQKH